MDLRQFIIRRNKNGNKLVNIQRSSNMYRNNHGQQMIRVKTTNKFGAIHTRYISCEDIIECTFKACHDIPNYIDNRTRFLHGITVHQAFTYFAFVDDDRRVRKYKLADLKYDLNLGRIRIMNK